MLYTKFPDVVVYFTSPFHGPIVVLSLKECCLKLDIKVHIKIETQWNEQHKKNK